MFLKVGVKVLFVAIELFLGFYSLLISESLLIKFIFFAVTAALVSFGILKTINKILPTDSETLQLDGEEEN